MRNTTQYKLCGAKTFRRSSCKLITGHGGNLQNIEESIREIYIPDGFSPALHDKCNYYLKTGDYSVFTPEELEVLRIFVKYDQSGAEALIVAYDCEPLDYRQLFIHGIKPHVYVAMKLFKDIWRKKMKQTGGLIEDFNIETISNTPIGQLKQNPFWRDLDLLIKDSDNWSLQERYYYLAKQTVHCVDSETEVLTPDGWMPFPKLKHTDVVAIYDGQNIKMERPLSLIISPYFGEMIYFKGEEIDQLVTPNHKIVYVSNGKQHIERADYVKNLQRPNIPTSGMYVGGSINLKDWEIKLLVAIQADGYIETENRIRFKFAKDRKINRLHDILIEAGLEYTFSPYVDETSGGNIVSDFGVLCPHLIKMFNGTKKWDSWLLNLSANNLILLIDELKYWDGRFTESYSHKREEYFSSIDQNIDWIKTICHLINKQGTKGSTYPDGSCKLGINNRKLSIAKRKSSCQYNGFIYCLTVSTGMFLVRRNGKISITHNSANYDIQEDNFILNILEKSGGKIVVKKDQGRFFLETYRSIFPEIPERNRRVKKQVEETKIIYNMLGHPYQITDYHLMDSSMKEYYAWGPQSTVGEITRIAFSQLQTYIEDQKKQWDMLIDNHDMYMSQCKLYDIKECSLKMKEYMNQKLVSPIDGVEFNMKSECQIGFNWAHKTEKNDMGLREVNWL